MVDIDGKLEIFGASLVSDIPEAGSFFSAIYGLLWPEDEDYIETLTKNVNHAIQECLDHEKVVKLRRSMEETRNICHEYINAMRDENDRRERCLSLHEVFEKLKPDFMDMSYESVVYFVQFAVLHIAVNVDMVILFTSGHAALDEKNKQNLRCLINEYSLYAQKMSIKLVEFRISQISTVCTCCLDSADPLVVVVSAK